MDQKFDYMMLWRLQSDCDYFLGYGSASVKHLHQGSVQAQIEEMKRLWNKFEAKPEWLSMDQINIYEQQMKEMLMLLSLMDDCDHFLRYADGNEKSLLHGSVESQINEMKRLWDKLEEKPPIWLDMDRINYYEKRMKESLIISRQEQAHAKQ